MIDLKEQAGIAMNVRGQFSDPIADPQVTLGALAFADDLGRLLWRMKYGQDVKRSGLHRATLLLASRIRHAGKFQREKFTGLTRAENAQRRKGVAVERSQTDIVERFAKRVIIEWVADQCVRCLGRGVIGRMMDERPMAMSCVCCSGKGAISLADELIPFAARKDGSGPMVFREWMRCEPCAGRGTVLVPPKPKRESRQICPDCNGTAKQRVDEPARALALGVSLGLYRDQWARHFHAVLALLDAVDGRAADTTRFQTRG